jgi:hypothetical protein
MDVPTDELKFIRDDFALLAQSYSAILGEIDEGRYDIAKLLLAGASRVAQSGVTMIDGRYLMKQVGAFCT